MRERQGRGRAVGVPKAEPWRPADYEVADVAAIQAVANGRASEDQQCRAMRYIIETVCGTYDASFRPDAMGGERATAFAEGKRNVGLQLVKLVRISLAVLRGKDTEQGSASKPREQP